MGRKLDDDEVLGPRGIDRVAKCLRSLLPFVRELFDTTPILPNSFPFCDAQAIAAAGSVSKNDFKYSASVQGGFHGSCIPSSAA